MIILGRIIHGHQIVMALLIKDGFSTSCPNLLKRWAILYPELENGVDFTVPDGVNALHAVSKEFDSQADIACTPRSVIHFGKTYISHAVLATIGNSGKTFLTLFEVIKDTSTAGFTLSWSTEINNRKPNVTDY